jgi:hypothetical protein
VRDEPNRRRIYVERLQEQHRRLIVVITFEIDLWILGEQGVLYENGRSVSPIPRKLRDRASNKIRQASSAPGGRTFGAKL